jgi:AraC family ethanolamine operon transcriptional activator
MFRKTFNDLDVLTASAPGWDVDFRRVRPGPFHGEIRVLGSTRGQILDAAFDTPVDQSGYSPPGVVTMAFGQSTGLDTRWRGREVGPEPVIVFRPDREFETFSGPAFTVRTISLPLDLLAERAQLLGLPTWEELVGDGEVLEAGGELALLRSTTSSLLSASRANPALAGSVAGTHAIEEEIPDLLLRSLAGATGRGEEPEWRAQSDTRLVRKAKAILEARLEDPPSLSDLCRELNVSIRSLQYAFRHTAQSTPSAYLKSMRMTLVRRDLRAASRAPAPPVRVADVANRHGFWHMGQFARDYRRFFGELPSATLGVSPRGVQARTGRSRAARRDSRRC